MAIGLASTWDPDLIHEMAVAISDEARGRYNADHGQMESGGPLNGLANGLLTFWSPTINMARDPRWGRTAETYGEDPYLTSRLAVAFIRGLQEDDPRYLKVVSTPKHFAAYNKEYDRFEANAVISQQTLNGYYLPAFRAAITDGKAESIMSSYNAINGIPNTANKWLLTDLLSGNSRYSNFKRTNGSLCILHAAGTRCSPARPFRLVLGLRFLRTRVRICCFGRTRTDIADPQ